jgi:hypothetical protein
MVSLKVLKVQIEQQHRIVKSRVALRFGETTLQAIEKQPAIGQTDHRIMQRVVSSSSASFAARDIAIHDDEFLDSPLSLRMVLAVDSRILHVPFLWRTRYSRLSPMPVRRASRAASSTLNRSSG